MHFDDIGVCFDCGHAHLMDGVPAGFAVLKDHICSTHVHDNNKDKDSHLWPGKGSIDWKQTMELLRSAPQKPPLMLEIDGIEEKYDFPEAGRVVEARSEVRGQIAEINPSSQPDRFCLRNLTSHL
jgi:sugar phosphate isomerase/epimerase